MNACPNGCDTDPDPWGQCRDCIRRTERERVLKLIEADLAKWREYAPRWKLDTAETVLLCANQVDHVVAKIRKGEL